MAELATWRSPEGQETLKSIVAAKIPVWKDGLRERQVQPILHILDGQDVILCTATGDGKSALFTEFAGKPVGVIITPTKGLARNIVETLSNHGISAIAYDRENIVHAASQRRNLIEEVSSCDFRVVCVDPEHLKSPSWFKIFDAPKFQQNLIFVSVEEAHVVREWLIFRHSRSYPQLLPYLNTGRKVVVYVPSLEISTRIYIYLLRLDGSARVGRRVRQYNALCHPDFNSETLRLMETDSQLEIIIATVALANGVHCSTIQDVLSVGMPKTLSQTEQQGGRAARLPAAAASTFPNSIPPSNPLQGRKNKSKSAPENMDPAKAAILVETTCLNAARNRVWKNEPLNDTDRDCIAANRPLPCSLCALRANISVTFPSRTSSHPAFPIPPTASKRSPVPRAMKVKKKEHLIAVERLAAFGTQIFQNEIYSEVYPRRPKSWFFPPSLQETLADSVLRIANSADLDAILGAHGWPFRTSSHRDDLWLTVTKIQTAIRVARAAEVPRPRKGRAQPKQRQRHILLPAAHELRARLLFHCQPPVLPHHSPFRLYKPPLPSANVLLTMSQMNVSPKPVPWTNEL
ncbi:hypothetical protein B0H12DRAFT_1243083 [Mycena haematopus]|nr:hypothetical protein B0H12DRAFT_1243083 [Mycena haematopus]